MEVVCPSVCDLVSMFILSVEKQYGHRRSVKNIVEQVRVSRKSAQGRLYFLWALHKLH